MSKQIATVALPVDKYSKFIVLVDCFIKFSIFHGIVCSCYYSHITILTYLIFPPTYAYMYFIITFNKHAKVNTHKCTECVYFVDKCV